MKHWLNFLLFMGLSLPVSYAQPSTRVKKMVLQTFWWDYQNNNFPNGWANYLTELAPRLKSMGVDAVWIPPTVKNQDFGQKGVGYAPFDHYDLGDKFQKKSDTTRVGTKDELLRMVAVLHANGIEVIQDIVPNHIIGAGSDTGGGGQDPAAPVATCTDNWKNFRYACYKTPATDQSAADYLSHDDDGGIGMACAQTLQDGQPINVGQPDIQQDQLRLFGQGQPEAVLATRGLQYGVAFILQYQLQCPQRRALIFHNQEHRLGTRHAGRSAGTDNVNTAPRAPCPASIVPAIFSSSVRVTANPRPVPPCLVV